MSVGQVIVFVCEHGAAKSVIAAAYFNKLADKVGLDLCAVARGTHPDQKVSPQTVAGLTKDGLLLEETVPRKLSAKDVEAAQRVITFCELPEEYSQQASIERWEGIPPVSEDYEKAREAIMARIDQLLSRMSGTNLEQS